jgi:hypothetical protein
MHRHKKGSGKGGNNSSGKGKGGHSFGIFLTTMAAMLAGCPIFAFANAECFHAKHLP